MLGVEHHLKKRLHYCFVVQVDDINFTKEVRKSKPVVKQGRKAVSPVPECQVADG